MTLSFDSPRFSLRNADFGSIAESVDSIGHAVIEDAWNKDYLRGLLEQAAENFSRDDELYRNKQPLPDLHGYLGGETTFEQIQGGSQGYEQLSVEFERAGLPALFHYLYGQTPFTLSHTFCSIRRIDPRIHMRFTGLHPDGQLRHWATHGIYSKREFTLWTPLLDCCDEDTPRLLLLHRNERFQDVQDLFGEEDRIKLDDVPEFIPITLKPVPIRDEEALATKADAERVENQFARLYERKRCYAPHVPFGSAVLFEHCVVHGSYRTTGMQKPRFSMDCRIMGQFQADRTTMPFQGAVYSATPLSIHKEAANKLSTVELLHRIVERHPALHGAIRKLRGK